MTALFAPWPAGVVQIICICVRDVIGHETPPTLTVTTADAGPKFVPVIVSESTSVRKVEGLQVETRGASYTNGNAEEINPSKVVNTMESVPAPATVLHVTLEWDQLTIVQLVTEPAFAPKLVPVNTTDVLPTVGPLEGLMLVSEGGSYENEN
jgi:hypothetical protein